MANKYTMQYTGHILELENALSTTQCAAAIDWYNRKQADAEWHYACEGEHDTYIHANLYGSYMELLGKQVNAQLITVYAEYCEHTGFRPKNISHSFDHKFQKHVPGGGFQKWHCEHHHHSNDQYRCAVWMYYLNEQALAGTEFLYPELTVSAQTGKLVIFPAYGTHVHRTETGYTQDKYILTGWFCTNP